MNIEFIQLPNGCYLKADTIIAVRPMTATPVTGLPDLGSYVIVDCGKFTEIVLAESDEHARAIADEIFQQLNKESVRISAGFEGGVLGGMKETFASECEQAPGTPGSSP